MTTAANQQRVETILGVVERLTYHSEESGYSVARLKSSGHRDLITIVGSFANIHPLLLLPKSKNTKEINWQQPD